MVIKTIRVTRECIKKGERCEARKCPVALALIRNKMWRPSVSDIYLRFTYAGKRRKISTPECVENFIGQFDGSDYWHEVSPFSFKVTIG